MQESTTPKEKLLKKIRKALIEKTENPYPKLDETAIYAVSDELLEIQFAQEFTRINGQFLFCENEIQFIESLIAFAEEKKWRKIFCWEPALQELLRKYEYPFIPNDKEFEQADVGITLCEGLIARTGSILVSSANASGRRLSIYPHQHIVVAYVSQLFPDLKEALARMKDRFGERLPSSITSISGPSRTADIEKTLVLGAHGPRELFLFLIDDIHTHNPDRG